MKQKMSLMLMAIMLLPSWHVSDAKAAADYDYEIVSQSANPTLQQGESQLVWVKFKNTGTQTWQPDSWIIPLEDKNGESCINGEDTNDEDIKGGCVLPPNPSTKNPFRLGTTRPQDRNSGFKSDYDWVSSNRVNANFWEEVAPGQTVTIGFNIFAPYDMIPGVYPEYFAPVIEGISWLPDKNLHWDITVTPQENDYAAEVWSYYQTNFQLKAGETTEVIYDMKNTGRETWYKNGVNPVHIATTEPHDRSSRLYNADSWLAPNRPNGINNEAVAPGESTTVSFRVTAPNEPAGTKITEAFWLVAENKQWFAPGSYPTTTMDVTIEIVDENTNIFDADNSTINADKLKVLADNSDSALLTINLIDTLGNPIADQELMLTAYGCVKTGLGCWQEDEQKLITNQKGQTEISVKNDRESTMTYSFHVGDSYSNNYLTIDFYKAGHEYISFSDLSADKTRISASKNESANVQSYLEYDNGDPVPYYYVDIFINGGEYVDYNYNDGDSNIAPWPDSNIWTDEKGKATYKINASNYKAGDKITVKFRANNLPPAEWNDYIESDEITLEII